MAALETCDRKLRTSTSSAKVILNHQLLLEFLLVLIFYNHELTLTYNCLAKVIFHSIRFSAVILDWIGLFHIRYAFSKQFQLLKSNQFNGK